jgi:hypothetical protein
MATVAAAANILIIFPKECDSFHLWQQGAPGMGVGCVCAWGEGIVGALGKGGV